MLYIYILSYYTMLFTVAQEEPGPRSSINVLSSLPIQASPAWWTFVRH